MKRQKEIQAQLEIYVNKKKEKILRTFSARIALSDN